MARVLLIALGGGIGSALRYLCTSVVHQLYGAIFPAGTFVVNVLGSFAIGLLWVYSDRFTFSRETRVFIFVGILGGFTTFSSYAIETLNLLQDKQITLAAANVLGTNILCLLACYAGFMAGNILTNRMR
jgi:fluoride exporter